MCETLYEGIKVWKIREPHPYPWRFSVTFRFREWQFVGIPNYCVSRQHAITRARAKLKQMRKVRAK